MTRYTSRVAVELVPTVDRPGPTRDVAAGLPAGSQLMGPLPAGGTLDPVWRVLGWTLLLTGLTLLAARRRRWAR